MRLEKVSPTRIVRSQNFDIPDILKGIFEGFIALWQAISVQLLVNLDMYV